MVVPIPTPSILIISSLILIKSPPKNDTVLSTKIVSSVVNILLTNFAVVEVETTGDWMRLSSATTTFAFWFIEVNLCNVPIPTLVISKTSGTNLRASSALLASLTLFISTFTIKTLSGNLLVVPTPTDGKLVDAIPIAFAVTIPVILLELEYLTCSPVTKKWFGKEIVFEVVLTIVEALPTKYLSNIGLFLWVKLNARLISTSVPS